MRAQLTAHQATCDTRVASAPVASDPRRLLVAATCSDSMEGWPGRRAATIHLQGCSMTCAYCCHPEFVGKRTPSTDVKTLLGVLERWAGTVGGVVISGGEPTDSGALRPLLESIRGLGLPAKLDTSGVSPSVLASLIADELVSFVALDIKGLPDAYDRITGASRIWERVAQSVALVLASGIDHEFRTTCYPFAIRSDELPRLASYLVGGRRYVLQQFRPRRTLDPAAATVTPYSAQELQRAALRCTVHLPTVVRGI